MSNGAYAGLRMAARAAKPDPESDPNETEPDNDEDDKAKSKSKNKDAKPMDENCEDKASFDAGFSAANARFNTVLASDAYAGNEAQAKVLLANDKLSADEIISILAAANPAAPAAASDEDSDDAARAEMQAALAANANSNIDASAASEAGVKTPESAASIWDQAHANCNFQ